MNNMVNYFLTESEKELLDEIQAIGYGEIYDVSFKVGAPYGMEKIDFSFITLFRLLKSGIKFNVIVIHDNSPSIGQLDGKTNSGYRYLQKVKF